MTEHIYEIIKALNYLSTRELEEGWLKCFEQTVKVHDEEVQDG